MDVKRSKGAEWFVLKRGGAISGGALNGRFSDTRRFKAMCGRAIFLKQSVPGRLHVRRLIGIGAFNPMGI